MSNWGLTSKWFDKETVEDLLKILCDGDVLEFDRGVYHHWAVCVSVEHGVTVVHRSGQAYSRTLVFQSHSSNKRGRGVGEICKDRLRDVLCADTVRINNSHDKDAEPKAVSEIVAFAIEAIGSDDFGVYNLVTNNCEHFAKLCRNDHKSSKQSTTGVEALLGFFGAAVIVIGGAFAIASRLSTRKERQRSDSQSD